MHGGKEAQKFLDLHDDPLTDVPIPDDHLKQAAEFIKWTIGTTDIPASVNSRQQEEFEQVLASPKALESFRLKGDLEASLLYTEYSSDEIASKFRNAASGIEDCLTKLLDMRESVAVEESFAALELAYKKARVSMKFRVRSEDTD